MQDDNSCLINLFGHKFHLEKKDHANEPIQWSKLTCRYNQDDCQETAGKELQARSVAESNSVLFSAVSRF